MSSAKAAEKKPKADASVKKRNPRRSSEQIIIERFAAYADGAPEEVKDDAMVLVRKAAEMVAKSKAEAKAEAKKLSSVKKKLAGIPAEVLEKYLDELKK